ncbi:MAG: stage II sporulation protein D [Clostridia bacterium]
MKYRFSFLHFFTAFFIILTVVLFAVNMLKDIDKKNKKDDQKQLQEEKKIIEYKANETIRVKMSKTGEIIAMDINDYLRGVLPSEMPPSYNIEALKAQAIVARTYTYRKMQYSVEGPDCDICDNFNHCQAFYNKEKILQIWNSRGYDENLRNEYWEKINEAVVSTQNQVILYGGEYIKAFFHASSPEKTENIDQIWGGEKLPYLVSVENKESEEYENRYSRVKLSFNDFKTKLCKSDKNININEENVKNICISEYTTSGRVKNIKIGEYVLSAEKLRTILGLKSTNFKVYIQEDSVIFDVIGYGHGVGMSQVGANYLATNGLDHKQIINFYYKGVDVVTLNK